MKLAHTHHAPYQSDRHRGRPGRTQQGAEGRTTGRERGGGWQSCPPGALGDQINPGLCKAGQGRAAAPGATHSLTHHTPTPVGTPHPHIQRARQPPGPTLTTHLHTCPHTHCPHTACPHPPQQPWGSVSSLSSLWLGSLDSPAKTPPWPPGKPGETLLVSPTCSPRTPAWPAPQSAEGAQEQARRGTGVWERPPTPSTAIALEFAERSGQPNPRSARRVAEPLERGSQGRPGWTGGLELPGGQTAPKSRSGWVGLLS